MGHPSIKAVITLCQKIVTFVRASHLTLANLTKRAKESKPPINTGLKSSNTTRLTSTFLCISSVLEHRRVLISMLHAQEISSTVVSKIIMDGAFWTRLSDIYHLLKPFSDVIMSIQSNESRLADVARYWIYLTRSVCSFLGASTFDNSIKEHIQFAFNKRTVEIPPVISLLALYLDPRFRGAFSVSEDVLKLISIEAAIIMFKRRLYSEEDFEVLVDQMKAYAFWKEPFCFRGFGGEAFNILDWWRKLFTDRPAEVSMIAKLAIYLHTAKAHAAGPERVFSLFDWHQTKRRNRLLMKNVYQSSVITMFYNNHDAAKKGTKRKLEVMLDIPEENQAVEDPEDLSGEAIDQLLTEVYEDDLTISNEALVEHGNESPNYDEPSEVGIHFNPVWFQQNQYGFICFNNVNYDFPRFTPENKDVVSPPIELPEPKTPQQVSNVIALVHKRFSPNK